MVEAKVRVLYGDTDQMGVVYYANYLRYFELGRGELIRQKGMTYREMEAAGARLPVVEAQVRFHSPARYDDILLIRTSVIQMRRASVTFVYTVVTEAAPDRVLCTGKTVHACIDSMGKPTRLPERVVELLGPLEKDSL